VRYVWRMCRTSEMRYRRFVMTATPSRPWSEARGLALSFYRARQISVDWRTYLCIHNNMHYALCSKHNKYIISHLLMGKFINISGGANNFNINLSRGIEPTQLKKSWWTLFVGIREDEDSCSYKLYFQLSNSTCMFKNQLPPPTVNVCRLSHC